jgi:hypothetical protein
MGLYSQHFISIKKVQHKVYYKDMKKSLSQFVFLAGMTCVLITSFSLSAIAQVTKPPASNSSGSNINITLQNPLSGTNTLDGFLGKILDAVVLLLTPVVVIMMLYSGFLFVVARGNSEKLGEAKKALMYTLIGAAIVLGAKGFSTVIQNTISQF